MHQSYNWFTSIGMDAPYSILFPTLFIQLRLGLQKTYKHQECRALQPIPGQNRHLNAAGYTYGLTEKSCEEGTNNKGPRKKPGTNLLINTARNGQDFFPEAMPGNAAYI